ncbi:hypothetical protein SLE2022_193680 [Rubroshorea leprosula]
MNPGSVNSVNRILKKSLFCANFIPKSTFSASSLQIIPTLESKSVSSPLFHLLPENQNPNNIVNLVCSALKQDNFSLSLFKSDIKGLIPHLGTHEISRVLLRCQSDSTSALSFFNWVKTDLGVKLTAENYCYIIHILAWSHNFPVAMKLLCELISLVKECSPTEDVVRSLILYRQDCNWNPVIFDMLIKAYVKGGMVEEGFRTFKKTVEAGYTPNVIACNCLLNGLLGSNFADECWQVYEVMGRVGIRPNSYTFNILTNAFCKVGNVDKVSDFLERMEEEGFDPDLVTYNTLISSYCRKGRLADAFYLYRIMYRRGVIPDLVSYTALMKGLCKEGKLQEAHQLFHRMVHRGLNPDVVSYNILISGYCKEGKMKESRNLLHEMIGNEIHPDSFTCQVLIEGYGKDGKLLSALNLVEELKRFRISVSWDIYDYLIVSLCQEDRPFAARNLLERLSQDGYIPKLEIYNELIKSLCRCDSVKDALLLKDEMTNRNTITNLVPTENIMADSVTYRAPKVKANLVTYRALVRCLCRKQRCEEAESLMEEMLKSGVLPDEEICRALVHGYCMKSDVQKAESLLVFFAKEYEIVDTHSYNELIRAISKDGDVVKLMELQDRMLKVGFAPSSLSFKYAIHGLWNAIGLDKQKLMVN